MSKEMPIKVFAKKIGIDKKEQEWIEKNDKETHYYNNSALKNSWLSLSYPIYDGDYYFAFIHDKARVNAQYNAKANRELKSYVKSFLDKDEIFDKMEKYFEMQFKDAGAGDTMTREELWTAIVDMRSKNPAPKKKTNEQVSFAFDTMKTAQTFERKVDGKPMNIVKVGTGKYYVVELRPDTDTKDRQNAAKIAVQMGLSESYIEEGQFWGQDKMAKSAKKMFNKNTHVKLVKDKGSYQSATISKKDKKKIAQLKKDGYKEVPLESVNENYRTLAKYGMGTETSRSARVGLELDFYDDKGNKQFGKILQRTNTGYLVKDDKGKKHVLKYHDRKKAAKMLKPNYIHTESSNIMDTYRQMNTQQQETFNEASSGEMIDKLFNLKGDKDSQYGVAKMLNMTGVKVVQAMQKQNPQGFAKLVAQLGKEKKITLPTNNKLMKMFKQQGVKPLPESINEVKKQEVDAMKKISKDMQSVLKAYQKVASMGDKTLKDTKHNASYKKVLDARDAILKMIGTLNTQMLLTREETNLWSKLMTEEQITYKVKGMQTPERQKFRQSAKMMKVQLDIIDSDRQTNKVKKGETVLIVTGTKKKLRDFDSVVRGKSSYGDPSTIKHFDEK